MVALAGSIATVATVPFFHAMGIWVVVLEGHFMWSRIHWAAAVFIPQVFTLLVPVVGYLTDRCGPRRLVLPGLFIITVGFVSFGLIQSLGSYYASIIILVIGMELCGSIPLVVMLSHWFVSRRAVAIAVFLAIPQILALVVVPLIAWGADTETAGPGWRSTAFIVAGIATLATVMAFMRMRNTPVAMAPSANGDSRSAPPVRETGYSLGQALRSRPFLLIAFGDGLALASLAAARLIANSKGLDIDTGLTFFSLILTIGTLVSICFYLVGGLTGDRFPKYKVMASFAIVQAGGILVLFFSGNIPAISLALVLMSAGAGGLVPLSLAIIPDYFGTRSLGSILGIQALLVAVVTTAVPAAALVGLGLDDDLSNALLLLLPLGLTLLAAFLFLKATPPRPADFTANPAGEPSPVA